VPENCQRRQVEGMLAPNLPEIYAMEPNFRLTDGLFESRDTVLGKARWGRMYVVIGTA